MDILNVDEVRNVLGFGEEEFSDDTIQTMIRNVQAEIEDLLGTKFEEVDVTEYYDGNGLNWFYLKHFPVISVTGLYVDYDDDDVYEEIPDDEYYWFEDGRIELNHNASLISKFPQRVKNIKVVYRYGYTYVPEYIKRYAILKISQMLNPNPKLQPEIDKLEQRLKRIVITMV